MEKQNNGYHFTSKKAPAIAGVVALFVPLFYIYATVMQFLRMGFIIYGHVLSIAIEANTHVIVKMIVFFIIALFFSKRKPILFVIPIIISLLHLIRHTHFFVVHIMLSGSGMLLMEGTTGNTLQLAWLISNLFIYIMMIVGWCLVLKGTIYKRVAVIGMGALILSYFLSTVFLFGAPPHWAHLSFFLPYAILVMGLQEREPILLTVESEENQSQSLREQ